MSAPDPTDEQLARRAAAGERAATTALVERYRTILVGYVRRCLKVPEQDIDDIAGDTWERALRKMHRRQEGNFLAWLRTIALNVVRDRAKKKRPAVDSEVVGLVAAPEEQRPEANPKLPGCLDRLKDTSPKYHAAIIAVYYEGQPQDEAAAALTVDPGTFRTQLYKAKAQLRKCLEGENS